MKTSTPELTAGVVCRRTAIAGAMAAALTAASATAAQAADPRLTNADAALQTARGLVLAAEPGNVSARTRARFERHIAHAAELIDRARKQIQAAKDAVDTPAQ